MSNWSESLTFKAVRISLDDEGKASRAIVERKAPELPEGEVLIKVKYAALNFKDGLSANGNKGVTRNFPHTPGIDAAGTVVESTHGDIKAGDEVIVTSYDLGMNTDGAFAEYISVPAEWVLPLPSSMSMKESMIIGTAGLTAGIGLWKMEQGGQKPENGKILITGATGGVGSLAVSIFSKAGYTVAASTGKMEEADYLKSLGAEEVIDRNTLSEENKRPMLKPAFGGAYDTVGGTTLSNVLKQVGYGANVAICGMVTGPNFDANVFPFILRNINLLGVDSAELPLKWRKIVWENLANDWKPTNLEEIAKVVTLEEIDPYFDAILKGEVKGRVLVAF
ncbi:YhdH/YhfP family quinone oxidoreductase [Persicobacter psychrovividus]|uniref:Oxidoreductase n=1 Tax=Persicobacter psychrovividus TaxID=387638 RepID=A0ABM7VFU8_9BACT|nr:oxidoreductase [Persicobacter psychrovividus]